MTDDTATIRSTLKDLTGLPVPVHGWDIRQGLDATDDPAVWIWAVIDEDDFDGEPPCKSPTPFRRPSG